MHFHFANLLHAAIEAVSLAIILTMAWAGCRWLVNQAKRLWTRKPDQIVLRATRD